MKSGWQDYVMQNGPAVQYHDPRSHGLQEPDQYTLWDLMAVQQADIILAYMESDNPSGIGLSVEVGYAKALGIPILFIDGVSEDKRFDIARSCADAVTSSLDEGIKLLWQLSHLQ